MKIVKFEGKTKLVIEKIRGFMERRVVVSGTSAKVNVPKEYLGCDSYLVIVDGKKKNDA